MHYCRWSRNTKTFKSLFILRTIYNYVKKHCASILIRRRRLSRPAFSLRSVGSSCEPFSSSKYIARLVISLFRPFCKNVCALLKFPSCGIHFCVESEARKWPWCSQIHFLSYQTMNGAFATRTSPCASWNVNLMSIVPGTHSAFLIYRPGHTSHEAQHIQ
jgi:hypothetical protein